MSLPSACMASVIVQLLSVQSVGISCGQLLIWRWPKHPTSPFLILTVHGFICPKSIFHLSSVRLVILLHRMPYSWAKSMFHPTPARLVIRLHLPLRLPFTCVVIHLQLHWTSMWLLILLGLFHGMWLVHSLDMFRFYVHVTTAGLAVWSTVPLVGVTAPLPIWWSFVWLLLKRGGYPAIKSTCTKYTTYRGNFSLAESQATKKT